MSVPWPLAILALAALEPPDLDALLEEADIGDRHRIERVLFNARQHIEDVLGLEAELGASAERLQPRFADLIGLHAVVRHEATRFEGRRLRSFELLVLLSVDLDRIVARIAGAPLPSPRAEESRRALCLSLTGGPRWISPSELDRAAEAARAEALGCEGGAG